MGCNNSNRGCSDPCKEPCKSSCVPKCSCAVKIGSSCVHYDGEEPLDNLEVVQGEELTSILKKINDLDRTGTEEGHVNIGGGAEVYKQKNLMGETELRTITSSDSSVEIIETSSTIDIKTDSKQIVSSDNTLSIDEGINEVDLKVNSKQVVSSDGSITINYTPTTIDISYIPEASTDVPRYVVNNRYTGAEEKGTISQPYKSIATAISTFVGTGTRDNPQNQNAVIVIQKGNTYVYTGDFSYRNLNIVIEEGALIQHRPTTGSWLADYDMLTSTKANLTIEVKTGAILRLYEKGFRNRGSTGGAAQAKGIRLTGAGEIDLVGPKANGYVMFEANYNNLSGYHMPSFQNFNVVGLKISALEKDIWNLGIHTAIIITGSTIRHSYKGTTIDNTSKTFRQLGGIVTLSNCTLSINGPGREGVFYITKISGEQSRLTLENCALNYPDAIEALFVREGTENPTIECQGLSTTEALPLTNIFEVSGLTIWNTINFTYNIIKGGEISKKDLTGKYLADLTRGNTKSVTNNIGGKERVSLPTFTNRAAAASTLGAGSLFINNPDGTDANKFIDITI